MVPGFVVGPNTAKFIKYKVQSARLTFAHCNCKYNAYVDLTTVKVQTRPTLQTNCCIYFKDLSCRSSYCDPF